MMNSSNTNKNISIANSKLLQLKKDLKLIVISYLPIETNFYSLITCNRSFKILIKNLNVFGLITSGLIRTTLKEETLTNEFKNEMTLKWQKYFDDLEQRDKFVSRILKRTYLNKRSFLYQNETCTTELEKAYILFLMEAKEIEQMKFSAFNFGIEKEIQLLKNIGVIFSHTNISFIYLNCNKIGNEAARAISDILISNNSLQFMDLNGNSIGDEGAHAIADALRINVSLEMIDLHWNQIGNKGVKALAEALKSNISLKYIFLNKNQIQDEGAEALADAIRNNVYLEFIDINMNQIKNKGAKALADALKTNDSLLYIYLLHNQIGDEGAEAIVEALESNSSLQEIDISSNQIGTEVKAKINDRRIYI